MEDCVVSANVLNAEIKKSLKVVMFYFSFCSCERTGNLFAYMFSDSETVKKFSLGRTNCSYFVNFGIAPHFKTILHNVQKSPFFTVSFDESLNKVLQNEQMDIQVCFWDENSV